MFYPFMIVLLFSSGIFADPAPQTSEELIATDIIDNNNSPSDTRSVKYSDHLEAATAATDIQCGTGYPTYVTCGGPEIVEADGSFSVLNCVPGKFY